MLKKQRLEMGNHIGGFEATYPTKLHTASELMSRNNPPYYRSKSDFIPPSHSVAVPPGDDTAMSSSSETTPPMQTPPQDIRSTAAGSQLSNAAILRTASGDGGGGGGGLAPQPQPQQPSHAQQQQQQQHVLQQSLTLPTISNHAVKHIIPQHLPPQSSATYDPAAAAAVAMANYNEDMLAAMQIGAQQAQQQLIQYQQHLNRQKLLQAHQQQHLQQQQQHVGGRPESPTVLSSRHSAVPYEYQNAVGGSTIMDAQQQMLSSRRPSSHVPSVALINPLHVDETAVDFDYGDVQAYNQPPQHFRDFAATPQVSRTPSQMGSRSSFRSQQMNDHFDQYTMAANPTAAKLMHLRTRRRGGRVAAPPAGVAGGGWEGVRPESAQLVRRSTLATARDWQLSSTYDSTNPPLAGGSPSATPIKEFGVVGPRRYKTPVLKQFSIHDYIDNRSSMPDLMELEKSPVQMTREEVARLSSQRRQEMQREIEEAELLRSNPLRYFKYLYHPSVRVSCLFVIYM